MNCPLFYFKKPPLCAQTPKAFKMNLDIRAQSIISVRKTCRPAVKLYSYAQKRRDGSGSPATAFCGRRL